MSWDFFISHASEDKSLAREIAFSLAKRGKRVWFDEFTLCVGDSLRRSIDYGLIHSNFGIVILSPNFFAKEWPNKELDALIARDNGNKKVIIPIWHMIKQQDILRFSPILADKLAINSQLPMNEITHKIIKVSNQVLSTEASLTLSTLIIGATGSGKTTLSQKLWDQPLAYTLNNGIIENINTLIHKEDSSTYCIKHYTLSYGDKPDEEFIESATDLIRMVDCVLWVSSLRHGFGISERRLFKIILNSNKTPVILALNFGNIDLPNNSAENSIINEKISLIASELNISKTNIIPTSAVYNHGIKELRDILLKTILV
ncbi:TIR domain-containing protein [Thiothrix subterranea]|uniref:TIR domain-containing protein n=1 Tax=Thiothrix subterranea TaxID=2735563 RepID=A0AA51R305_9GAMM|nr:TIR domain-containing protein [Thiothrix subterranea]MDQ5771023.1 TIR domain-containing protein [Thiothrix subterranea]WML85070.1 TIR domain-containing protein [Thiothrix subterranea]